MVPLCYILVYHNRSIYDADWFNNIIPVPLRLYFSRYLSVCTSWSILAKRNSSYNFLDSTELNNAQHRITEIVVKTNVDIFFVDFLFSQLTVWSLKCIAAAKFKYYILCYIILLMYCITKLPDRYNSNTNFR